MFPTVRKHFKIKFDVLLYFKCSKLYKFLVRLNISFKEKPIFTQEYPLVINKIIFRN